MRKLAIGLPLLAIFLSACGPSDPHDALLKGTWQHTSENGIANTKEQVLVTVTADHDRFRMDTKSSTSQSNEVYDGHTLYTKIAYSTEDPSDPTGEVLAPTESAQAKTPDQVWPDRFWEKALTNGHPEPGGLVAERDTLLYRSTDHRIDGDISEQDWVDAKTGVLLKQISSIYSSQANTLVRQETWECRSITYGPVDPSTFQKP